MAPVVLIVDDDPLVFTDLRRRLDQHPFSLISACDGVDALRVIGQTEVDVVVSDENMPRMPGLALLGVLAQQRPNIVRVMMTGNARTSVAVAAINRGQVFRFLVKPFDALDLVGVLNEALAHRQQRATELRLRELANEQFELLRALQSNPLPGSVDAPSEPALLEQAPTRLDVLEALSVAERDSLTKREAELVRNLARGLRINQLAEHLQISRHTVRNHLRAVFAKLGVHSQQELLGKLLAQAS